MNTDQRDAEERVARLERLATRVTRYEGRSSDVIVPVQNVSGGDLAHGSTVVLSEIGADGVLEVTKPDADSDRKYLGHIVGKLLSGAFGRCQIAGVAEALRNTEAGSGGAPSIGAHIGPEEDAVTLGHDQFGSRFLCDLYDALGGYTKVCLVLLQATDRLVADHRGSHVESTPVYEPINVLDTTYWFNGTLSDLMSVVQVKSGRDSTHTLAVDFRRVSGHNHGWFKGVVIEEGGTGQDIGWGPIASVIGIRGPNAGQSFVDLDQKQCQLNSGKNSLLIGTHDDKVAVDVDGQYVYGWMVPHIPSQTWRPAVPVPYELRSIKLSPADMGTWTRECGESDPCRLLLDPLRYRKSGPGHITGPHDSSTSLMNYLEWIACNRADINGIFDLLWYVSCCFSWKVGEIDSNLQSTFGTLVNWTSAVNACLACLAAIHSPQCDPQYNAVVVAHNNMIWYDADHCSKGPCGTMGIDLPYLLTCPYWGQQA